MVESQKTSGNAESELAQLPSREVADGSGGTGHEAQGTHIAKRAHEDVRYKTLKNHGLFLAVVLNCSREPETFLRPPL